MKSLFLKTLYDKRWFMIGWSFGMALLGFLMIIFYPAFTQDGGIDELVKNLPPALQGLVGDLANLKHMDSYIGSQLFEIRIPIFVSILSIILATSLTINEEEKGQLRTLLALPLSRTKVIFEKWLAMVTITFVVISATAIGLNIGLLIIHETVDPMVIIRLLAMTWLLCVSLATFVFGIGLATGKRALTMLLGVIMAIGSFLLTTFASSVEWLQPYEKISLLHYFPAVDIAKTGIEWGSASVLGVITLLALLLAVFCFRRRDVK